MYKLCIYNGLRRIKNRSEWGEKGTVNDTKLTNNLIRTKGRILELSLCNDWDCFVTLTIDKNKYDRYNLKSYIKDLSQFIRHQKQYTGYDIKYLLVPEQHLDGAWHLHGLFKNIPHEHIIPNGQKNKKTGQDYYHWTKYYEKFGFMSLGQIKDDFAVSIYMSKYITKALITTNIGLNSRMFYCSKGLNSAVKIDTTDVVMSTMNYQNTYKDEFIEVARLTETEYFDIITKKVEKLI